MVVEIILSLTNIAAVAAAGTLWYRNRALQNQIEELKQTVDDLQPTAYGGDWRRDVL